VNSNGIRKITTRECARLQGFPDDYPFDIPVTQAYKQLGNAVSVPVAHAVAEKISEALLEFELSKVKSAATYSQELNLLGAAA
jgi:DNA (cytosine-5)-methyltransferase 1